MKKIAVAIISIGVLLAFNACAWRVPEKISVKTDANYEFSLGTFEKELESDMDISKMTGDAGKDNAKINVYDYFPGKQEKNTQHFLLEVEVLKVDFMDGADAEAAFTTAGVDELTIGSGLTVSAVPDDEVGLELNPATILAGVKTALGPDMADKLEFAGPVPLYMYCEVTEGLSATATLKMYYGDNPTPPTAITKRLTTETVILDHASLSNAPRPVYEKEGDTIITDLAEEVCLGGHSVDLKDLINSSDPNIQPDDQLCITYSISSFSGTIKKEDAKDGLGLKIYAVIDLPVKFKVLDEIKLDINELTKGSSSSSSSGSNTNKEFSKFLDVIDTITIRYAAYKLPVYSTNGMELGIDMLGKGTVDSYQWAPIAVIDKSKRNHNTKSSITLSQATIMEMKDNANFNPKIQLKIKKDSSFSIPREKTVQLNIEMAIKTDGIVQVK